MKQTLLAAVVCLSAITRTAAAQMLSTIKVTLPFAASAGGVTLPAGEYTIRDLQGSAGTSVLQISARDGKSVFAMVMEVVAPKSQQPAEESSVVLKLTDAGYQIQTIWLAGREIGYELFNK
jgi:hypothetical protein